MIEYIFSSVRLTKLFLIISAIAIFYFSYLGFREYSQIEKVKSQGEIIEANISYIPHKCNVNKYFEVVFMENIYKIDTKNNICLILEGKKIGDKIKLIYFFDKKAIFVIYGQNNMVLLCSSILLFLSSIIILCVVISKIVDKELSDE